MLLPTGCGGGFLDFRRELCPWIGFCVVTGYKQVKAGKIKITKVGRKWVVAARTPWPIVTRSAVPPPERWPKTETRPRWRRAGLPECSAAELNSRKIPHQP